MFFQQVTNMIDIEATVPLALFESRKECLQRDSSHGLNTTTNPRSDQSLTVFVSNMSSIFKKIIAVAFSSSTSIKRE
jgi:hypothetical protein